MESSLATGLETHTENKRLRTSKTFTITRITAQYMWEHQLKKWRSFLTQEVIGSQLSQVSAQIATVRTLIKDSLRLSRMRLMTTRCVSMDQQH